MRPLYLYLENFTLFKKCELNLTNITSALLIVGRQDANELESNGVGKTSIFRAIEYALFAQTKDPVIGKDIVLEKLIQDNTAKLLVIFDFNLNGQIYRISRARTRKGSTDLYLFKRNSTPGNPHTTTTDKTLWEELTSRRTADTDAQIEKLIGMKYKAFINTNHCMQLDMGGIATATPEKRRGILKDVFDLLPYGAMEKIVKKRAEDILEAIKRDKILLEAIGDPSKDIATIQSKLIEIDAEVKIKAAIITEHKASHTSLNEEFVAATSQLNILETNAASIINRRNTLIAEVSKLQASTDEYMKRRKAIITEAKELLGSNKALQDQKAKLTGIDFSSLPKLKEGLEKSREEAKTKNIELGILKAELEDLNIPMPEDGTCKHCRTTLTPEHRRACMEKIETDKLSKTKAIAAITTYLKQLQHEQDTLGKSITALEQQQKQLNDINAQIATNDKEYAGKKATHGEYETLLKQFVSDLAAKQAELEQAKQDAENSSEKEINELKTKVATQKCQLANITTAIETTSKTMSDLQSKIAVLKHSIEDKNNDIKRKTNLRENIAKLETQYTTYPHVIQCFAEVPDMIIENVLEGLQEETNKLLVQMRPDLQLEFATEKTKGDGTQDNTLGINYFLNNKPKDYSQLSGAQKLCVMFAFKLGLSFYLKRVSGCQIKFLMLDEVDMPFSDAAEDAYADIIHLFQKDFMVFFVTHNSRLKSKFSNAILVEQDKNGISRAKVVSA
jgi:DNA repair exonuclease SbcCD ATPase subunit